MASSDKIKKSERTRESIIQQALLLFQEKGYEAVTMRDLASACDLSLGSFYYYFKNKEEVVRELFNASFCGHSERTRNYLSSSKPSLAAAMTWICRDRFEEFKSYQEVLRVLVQRLDPQDPASPWHKSSQHIREQSVELFELVVSRCMPHLDAKTRKQLARALWLHHLLILGVWAFDRSPKATETETVLKQSNRLWKSVPSLIRMPGMKVLFNSIVSPLARFEKEQT